jgi:hypothetical protein
MRDGGAPFAVDQRDEVGLIDVPAAHSFRLSARTRNFVPNKAAERTNAPLLWVLSVAMSCLRTACVGRFSLSHSLCSPPLVVAKMQHLG